MKNQNTAELQKKAPEVTKPSSPHLLYLFSAGRTAAPAPQQGQGRWDAAPQGLPPAVPSAAPCQHGEAAPCCTAVPHRPGGAGLFLQGCPVSVTLSDPMQTCTSPALPQAGSAPAPRPGRAGCGPAHPHESRGTYRAGAAVAELVEAELQI